MYYTTFPTSSSMVYMISSLSLQFYHVYSAKQIYTKHYFIYFQSIMSTSGAICTCFKYISHMHDLVQRKNL